MSDYTEIVWADATWSPITGCTRVSDGCTHCYIERTPPFRMAHRRFDGAGIGATTGVQLHPERLDIPLHWRKPRRVFVCSMADIFHDQVPDEYIAHIFAVMQSCAAHTFQVLTKRHQRMRSLLSSTDFWSCVTDFGSIVMGTRPSRMQHFPDHGLRHGYLPNVWLGVTAENQQWADIRIPYLFATPAAVRWISAEPLLSGIELGGWLPGAETRPGDRYSSITLDWVVVGGESGRGARPMHPDWARGLRDQCVGAQVPFLFKQWGEWRWVQEAADIAYEREYGDRFPQRWEVVRPDGSIAEDNIPRDGDAPMQRVGKKRAGRLLDGRTWDEYPEPVVAR